VVHLHPPIRWWRFEAVGKIQIQLSCILALMGN
jgi:hypothetical protein